MAAFWDKLSPHMSHVRCYALSQERREERVGGGGVLSARRVFTSAREDVQGAGDVIMRASYPALRCSVLPGDSLRECFMFALTLAYFTPRLHCSISTLEQPGQQALMRRITDHAAWQILTECCVCTHGCLRQTHTLHLAASVKYPTIFHL